MSARRRGSWGCRRVIRARCGRVYRTRAGPKGASAIHGVEDSMSEREMDLAADYRAVASEELDEVRDLIERRFGYRARFTTSRSSVCAPAAPRQWTTHSD